MREIIEGMKVKKMEKVKEDNVLKKELLIMKDFKGSYEGRKIWVEEKKKNEQKKDRNVRKGDGVKKIMIKENDFEREWEVEDKGNKMFKKVKKEKMKRIYEIRGGVNIVM